MVESQEIVANLPGLQLYEPIDLGDVPTFGAKVPDPLKAKHNHSELNELDLYLGQGKMRYAASSRLPNEDYKE